MVTWLQATGCYMPLVNLLSLPAGRVPNLSSFGGSWSNNYSALQFSKWVKAADKFKELSRRSTWEGKICRVIHEDERFRLLMVATFLSAEHYAAHLMIVYPKVYIIDFLIEWKVDKVDLDLSEYRLDLNLNLYSKN